MAKIRTYRCKPFSAGVSREITDPLGMEFPKAYTNHDDIVTLALAVKEHEGVNFCVVPFDKTVEAEAMGANINLGDANAGPRGAEPACTTLEDLQNLPAIDFSQGRVREVLEACRILADRGEVVALEVSGAWTVLSTLMEPRVLFRLYRKNRAEMVEVMHKVGEQLLAYVDQARECGVRIITFADSAGTVDILGPKLTEQSAEDFTCWFARELSDHLGPDMIAQICPKITYALIDTGHAEFKEYDMGGRIGFMEAALKMSGTVKLVGQACIKSPNLPLIHGKLREIIIK